MPDIYQDGEYLRKHPTWHMEDSGWKARHIETLLRSNHLAPKRFCEVGAGAGGVLRALAPNFPDAHFTGFEISADALGLAKRLPHDRIELVNGDAFASGRRFDLVMAIDVVEHVEDLFPFLRNMRTLAEYQLYHIPLDLSAQSVWRGRPLTIKREQLGHIHYFTKDTALACLTDTGHTIIDHLYTPSANDLHGRSVKASTLRRLRSLLFTASPDASVRILGGYSSLVLCREPTA